MSHTFLQAKNSFHSRITHSDTVNDPSTVITFARERTIKYLICRENADSGCSRDHLHFQFTHIEKLTENGRRNVQGNFKKYCPQLHGQADHMMKLHCQLGFHYTAKGTDRDWDTGAPNIVSTNFTLDEVKEFHRLYWDSKVVAEPEPVKAPIKVDLAQEPVQKISKPRTITWTERIVRELSDNHPARVWDKNSETDVMELTTYILRNMGARGRALDDFIFKRTFYAVYNGLATARKVNMQSTKDFDTHYGKIILQGW